MLISVVRIIATYPRRAFVAVLLFVVAAAALGGSVAGALEPEGGFIPRGADSTVAIERIEDATGRAPSAGIILLVETPGGADAASDRLEQVAADLADEAGVVDVSFPSNDSPDLVAEDGTSALVTGTVEADVDRDAVAEAIVHRFEAADDVTVGGQLISNFQIGDTVGEDLARAETLALPILVVLSLLFFGGRAALMPLVVGVTTVLGTFLALAGVNQVYGLSIFAINLVIGLGLGLAIDYTLFLVTRYREELERQGPVPGAIAVTMRTAGRTVVFSAATVAVALITLTVFPLEFLKSMGIAGAIVAIVAAAASLVIAPAFFGLWGAKLTRRSAARSTETRRWYRLSHAVMRRPGAVAAITAVVMMALALPALRASWSPIDSSVIPVDKSSRTVADTIQSDFTSSGNTPVTIAIQMDSGDPADAVQAYADEVSRIEGVTGIAPPAELDGRTWQIDVTADGAPAGDGAQRLVSEIRDIDTTLDVKVTGAAAGFVDQQDAIASSLPAALLLLVGLTLLVLWLMTGSVVLPVKAVFMNVLTVGSALGILTFIYQDGRLTGLLDYTPNGGIEPTDFLVAAALVFALSTDYGVFLLGRIKEARDAGAGERESVAAGLQSTGSVVTAAAILMAVAIGAFSTSSISFIQQIGVATAAGVLIDAFVVRSLLVPALMGLLGKWNWWAPMSLRRLHDRVGLQEGGVAEPDLVDVRTP
ncbi:MMPL family transporter [Aeromicrobium sp.]|uniref:MMPL family transporter n=1 Tax=Aeromicrobium sp. TaxID=1871063 RepID=UPI002FC7ECCB